MPDPTTLPLDQLLHYCPPLTQSQSAENDRAWYELQRRAFLQNNDAAWDALVTRLWPSVLTWIYAHVPDLSPAAAEQLAQQVILALFQKQRLHFSASPTLLSAPHISILSTISQILSHLLTAD